MKSTEDGPCNDLPASFDRENQRRILGQLQIRSTMVVVGSISFEDPPQVVFAQDHDVIQTLPTDRTDQPLPMLILPG
jgi:hypothetical protein